MNLVLRRMSAKEYDKFYKWSIDNHVSELVSDENLSFEDAISQTEQEVHDMLPDGLNTKDNYLMTIEDIESDKSVGFMWYLYEELDGVKQSFLCDFVIYEAERRKGYATQALIEMEHNAFKNGCRESVLFVSKANIAARKLYDNLGYKYVKDLDDGMYLKKQLKIGTN